MMPNAEAGAKEAADLYFAGLRMMGFIFEPQIEREACAMLANHFTTFSQQQVREAEKQVRFSGCQICGKETASVCTRCSDERIKRQCWEEAARKLREVEVLQGNPGGFASRLACEFEGNASRRSRAP